MFTETFTLFNYHKATGMWYLTVFSGTIFDVTKSKTPSIQAGLTNEDGIFIMVLCGADKSLAVTDSTPADTSEDDSDETSEETTDDTAEDDTPTDDTSTDETSEDSEDEAETTDETTDEETTDTEETSVVKAYKGPKAYASCDSPAAYYTFNPECDFVFHGTWESMDAIADDDYELGLYHELNDSYDGIYMISSAKFFGLLPHFEIEAR